MGEVLVLVHLKSWPSLLGNKPDDCYVVGMAIMLLEDMRREAKEHNWRSALIVTALDLELQAVIAHIELWASVKGRDGSIYECGIFHDGEVDLAHLVRARANGCLGGQEEPFRMRS
jgi:hypothetical protein